VVFFYETRRGEVVILRVLHQQQNAEALKWADAMEE
jgi:plasmid stabilization system protein ParE